MRVRIIDGDTVKVGGKSYRLSGIDAPENGQPARSPARSGWVSLLVLVLRVTAGLVPAIAGASLRRPRRRRRRSHW